MGELKREGGDATGAKSEDCVAGLDCALSVKSIPRGDGGARQGRRLCDIQMLGNGDNAFLVKDAIFREHAVNRATKCGIAEIGRAHVRTPVTNAHLVCRLLLEKNKVNSNTHDEHPTVVLASDAGEKIPQ